MDNQVSSVQIEAQFIRVWDLKHLRIVNNCILAFWVFGEVLLLVKELVEAEWTCILDIPVWDGQVPQFSDSDLNQSCLELRVLFLKAFFLIPLNSLCNGVSEPHFEMDQSYLNIRLCLAHDVNNGLYGRFLAEILIVSEQVLKDDLASAQDLGRAALREVEFDLEHFAV